MLLLLLMIFLCFSMYLKLTFCPLGESNWQLHEHMVEVAGQVYMGAARNLNSTTAQLVKSNSLVQVHLLCILLLPYISAPPPPPLCIWSPYAVGWMQKSRSLCWESSDIKVSSFFFFFFLSWIGYNVTLYASATAGDFASVISVISVCSASFLHNPIQR